MGFGIASRLPPKRSSVDVPEVCEGTFAYMAPEQTGRMNRSIDSRSDLYSFGVTLYEMLTGVLPFTASDAIEWVHCHVAREPMPPDSFSRAVFSSRGNLTSKSETSLTAHWARCSGPWSIRSWERVRRSLSIGET